MKITSGTLVVTVAFAAGMPVNAADAPYGPPADASSQALEPVIVTGSRIRRTAIEGPAPVTMITAEDIRNNGYATSYPYYESNWFDPTGRMFFIQYNYRIGGQNH
jgi:outer membrane cobalamin receptor